MKAQIEWLTDGVVLPELNYDLLETWIDEVARCHGKTAGELTYIFCNDEKILAVNRQYLSHDYFTDIITFDYTRGCRLRGDMFISLETVATNAGMVGEPYSDELLRVIIHGILHLCGINDKGPGERAIMEHNENQALELLNQLKYSL